MIMITLWSLCDVFQMADMALQALKYIAVIFFVILIHTKIRVYKNGYPVPVN